MQSNIGKLELAHSDTERHCQQLQRSLKSVEAERDLLTDKVGDLKAAVAEDAAALELLREQNRALKQKVQ